MKRTMNVVTVMAVGIMVFGLASSDYAPTGPYPPASYNNVNSDVSATGGGGSGGVIGGAGGGVVGGGGVIGGGGGGIVGGVTGPGPGPFFPGAPFFAGPGPLPPLPPFGLGPFGPPGTICHALETVRYRLTALSRPLVVAGLGAVLFWVVKSFLLPNIAIFASLFKRRMGVDEFDGISDEVSRAINSGVCYERIACSFGRMAVSRFPIMKNFLRIIDLPKSFWLADYFEIFKLAAVDDTCASHQCDYNEILPSR